jgi:hypothetical protein
MSARTASGGHATSLGWGWLSNGATHVRRRRPIVVAGRWAPTTAAESILRLRRGRTLSGQGSPSLHTHWGLVPLLRRRASLGLGLLLLFMLLLEFNEELGVVLYFVVNVFLAPRVLLSAKGRRVLQVDPTILTVKVRHSL